ncbi:MAG: PilZ domain-containing protein [Terracidiphilus sp.]
METQKFRVFNESRESSLSLEVFIVDTTTEPFKKLIDDLAVKAGTALWLRPYRGIPAVPGLQPFDLVYLDEENLVLQEVESFPNPEVKPLSAQPASALALPAHTTFASQTLTGDQLVFRNAPSAEQRNAGNVGEKERGVLRMPANSDPAARSAPMKAPPVLGGPLSDKKSQQLQQAIRTLDQEDEAESQGRKKISLKTRFLCWLNRSDPSERRRAGRHPLPGLVAYHWTGGNPKAYHVGNISQTGFFLLTDERPFPGTMILMTLQKTETSGINPEDSIAVHTRVVRWGPDGVGLDWVPSSPADRSVGNTLAQNGADQKALAEFLARLHILKDS